MLMFPFFPLPSTSGPQWRNWDGLNVDTSNPAGGLGRAVSPPAGFGAAPRKFFKFMVSITSGHLFLESLDGFLANLSKLLIKKKNVFCFQRFSLRRGSFALA